jgi:L-seryl-tRNA(Ser) seleniumtransferase
MREPLSPEIGALLRRLPAVDELLAGPSVQQALRAYPRWAVLAAVREVLAERRERLRQAPETGERLLDRAGIEAAVLAAAAGKGQPSLRPVLNATGVVIHTNFGRAPLARAAQDAIQAAARGYTNLEFDLEAGARGSRQSHVESLLCDLTGAEAALVVNNNAAAVLIAINTLADGKEIVISRGQLVEIGDAFRIPDVMVRAGGILREVGTTNRTHLADYEAAIGPATALVLKVHRSNFRLLGFTADVDTRELVALARGRGLPVMEDLGSGALLEMPQAGPDREPLAGEVVRAGVDVVTFSGDKLLGGPQAGILVGRRDLLGRIRRNPLARAVRIDKLCLAGLEATLRLLREPERAREEIPVLAMLALPAEAIGRRAEALAAALRAAGSPLRVEVEDGVSEVGGGALPLQSLPTRLLAVSPGPAGASAVEARLRRGRPPVLARIQEGRLLLDLRTVAPAEDDRLRDAVLAALGAEGPA